MPFSPPSPDTLVDEPVDQTEKFVPPSPNSLVEEKFTPPHPSELVEEPRVQATVPPWMERQQTAEEKPIEGVMPGDTLPGYEAPSPTPQLKATRPQGKLTQERAEVGAGEVVQQDPLAKIKKDLGEENLTDEEFIDQHPDLKARYGLTMTDERLRIKGPSTEQVSKTTGLGPKTAGVIAGAASAGAGLANFLTSPVGIATLASGGVAGAAGTSGNIGIQSALKAVTTRAFALDMARQYPDQTLQIMDSLSKGDTRGATEGILNAALSMGVIGEAVHSKLSPGVALDKRVEVPTGETPQGPLATGAVLDMRAGAKPPAPPEPTEVETAIGNVIGPKEAADFVAGKPGQPPPSAVKFQIQAIEQAAPILPKAAEAAAEVIGVENPIKKGVENAVQERSAETLPVGQRAEGGEEMGQGVPAPEKPPEAQGAEAQQVQPPVRLTESQEVAPVETPETYAAKSKVLADKIRSAFKTETQGQLFTGPVQLINAAVEVAAKIIESGGKVADAIDAAVKHLRANYKGKNYNSEVDEEAFAEKIRAAIGEEQPDTQEPTPSTEREAKSVYGIAERVREERAKSGQVDQVPTGEGISAPDSVDIGRALKSQGADPEAIMQAFEATQKLSSDDMAVVRAHGEDLARAARRAEEKSGTESPEYKAAYKALSDWDRRSKVMQTEWHKTGMAQQGETDIDTGTFTGLQRAYEDATGKELPPGKVDTAKQRAKRVREAFADAGKAKQKLLKHVADEGERSTAEKRAFDAANKTVREAAARLADAERKSREIDAKREADVRKIQESAEAKAKKAADKLVREAAVRLAAAEAKSRAAKTFGERRIAEDQEAAARRAFDAANKMVRENAARLARKETAERVKAAAAEKKSAEIERRDAQRKLDEANKRMREASVKAAKEETKNRILRADPRELVWKKVREYIDKGMDNPDDIRTKVATDLGMSVEEVTRALAKDKRTKFLTDDLWRKQQVARRLDQQARRWVTQAAIPGYLRALQAVPRIMFGMKVGFHGTVALGTHAPMVAFQPRFWNMYVRNFGKMYKMIGNRAYYEMQVQDLIRRPNYMTARRAGLVNDPFQYEDFNSPATTKYFTELIGKGTGMGTRGYSILKILRQDMFDQFWNQLPKTAKIGEVAEAISDGLNHATGVVKMAAPKGVHVALFAPRLEASRVAWLAVDPAKALATFANWKNASLGEKHFAMNQLKEKLWVAGTMYAILALNQGFLSATGSKQKINGLPEALGGRGFDPMESDFLKFKAAGMDISYGNAMLSMARLPARLAAAIMYEGKMSKMVLEDERVAKIIFDYVRSQMSPFAATATDLALGRDYAGRPLPRAGFGLLKGRTDIPKRLRLHGVAQPYTWPEYSWQQFTPIPISEGIREVWGKGGLGMTDKQIQQTLKALLVTSIMAGTGGRISDDWHD